MQNRPDSWDRIFAARHKTEYRIDINGVSYQGIDLKDAPSIKKPLLDKPAVGRCCIGSLQCTVYPKTGIPKAAPVNVFCRLKDSITGLVTDWLPQGKYWVSTRSGDNVLRLNCLDCMIKTGTTYRDKSQYTTWPQPMAVIVDEICSIMEVQLDPRTVINTGSDYKVDYPNDDTLIMEVLGQIGAAHGGNWVMTESGKLRLVVLSAPSPEVAQAVGTAHYGYTDRGKLQTISRIILEDDAGNTFTAGDDTGIAISGLCNYATRAMAATLCSVENISLENGCLSIQNGSINNGEAIIPNGSIQNGLLNVETASTLYGKSFQPYSLSGAYLNPAIEVGDTLSVVDEYGKTHIIIAYSITINCTVAYTCGLSALIDGETEDEYPYITMQELSLSRTVKLHQSYFGNRINREEGFVSELLVDGEIKARLTANASIFSMQQLVNDRWENRIYFDTAKNKYVISADVTIEGVVTFTDLSTTGRTVINGSNITTGVIQNSSKNLIIDLDNGLISLGGNNIATTLEQLGRNDNALTLAMTQLRSDTMDEIDARTFFIRYENGVIIIGEVDNPTSIRISNSQIGIYYNNEVVSWWNQNQQFTPKELQIPTGGKFTLGNILQQPRSNGNMSYLWVG